MNEEIKKVVEDLGLPLGNKTNLTNLGDKRTFHEYGVNYPLSFNCEIKEEKYSVPYGIYRYSLYNRKDGSFFLRVVDKDDVRLKMFYTNDNWFYRFPKIGEQKSFVVPNEELYLMLVGKHERFKSKIQDFFGV